MRLIIWRGFLLAIVTTFFTPHISAQEKIEDIVKRTYAGLPVYCHAKLNGPPVEQERWQRQLGSGFWHIHHHCFGLAQAMAAQLTTDANKRNSYLRNAITDYTYVITQSNPRELTIMGDVYMERAKAYMALRDFGKASADIAEAKKLSNNKPR